METTNMFTHQRRRWKKAGRRFRHRLFSLLHVCARKSDSDERFEIPDLPIRSLKRENVLLLLQTRYFSSKIIPKLSILYIVRTIVCATNVSGVDEVLYMHMDRDTAYDFCPRFRQARI